MLSTGEALEVLSANHRKDRRRHRKGGRRRWRIIVPLLLVCAVLAALVAADYWTNHAKIYPGVSAGSIPLGDKTPQEAQSILQERTGGGLKEINLTSPQE